jgi:hypothetical protein
MNVKTKKIKTRKEAGRGLFAMHAQNTDCIPSWSDQIGVAVVIQPQRNRVASGSISLWLRVVKDAINSAILIRSGKIPISLKDDILTPKNKLAVGARELVEWSNSEQVGGLRWISEMTKSCSGTPLDPERIAAKILEMVGPYLRNPKRSRRAFVAVIERDEVA